MTHAPALDPALRAYESLAPYYDRFTADYEYERWLGGIEARARGLGLSGRRLLDVGCGTGKSFAPMLARGYRVSACDISPSMAREAQRKHPASAEVFVADTRDLPRLGDFDLVTCIDDVLNYLLTDEDLAAAFESVADVLAPGGIYAFDVNSLRTYRTSFARAMVREGPGVLFCWRGEGHEAAEPGELASATIEVFLADEDDLWSRMSSRHVQRHHPAGVISEALTASGLECVLVLGQLPGCHLEDRADEEAHIKLVYFARKPVPDG
jgi:SAM-dependent methyltransferase